MSEIERDHRLDAAWSGASREEPPPALDTAIRAAARRAVEATPGRGRNKHWWYPLAAAATVAALAVGIVQLAPPENVVPTIVADTAVVAREAAPSFERQSAPAEAKPAAPAAAAPAVSPPPAYVPGKPARAAAPDASLDQRSRSAGVKPPPAQGAPAQREWREREEVAAAAPEASQMNAAPAARANAPIVATTPRSEPFPAAPMPAPRRDADLAGNAVKQEPAATVGEAQPGPSRTATAKVASAAATSLKDAPARSVAEWIRRIRDLKSEGRLEEAAKELAAFRATYGERADALLPADLQPSKR